MPIAGPRPRPTEEMIDAKVAEAERIYGSDYEEDEIIFVRDENEFIFSPPHPPPEEEQGG